VARFAQPPNVASWEEAPRERRTPIDVGAIRREVRQTIHALDRTRTSEAYWQVAGVANGIQPIAERARAFLEANDPASALAVLDAVTTEYVADWTGLDDSEGELGDVFVPLGAL